MLPQQHFDKTTIRSRAQGRKEAGPLAKRSVSERAGYRPYTILGGPTNPLSRLYKAFLTDS